MSSTEADLLRRPLPRRRFLRELERPRDVVSNITPNWFASVMGTGIVATAAASLPLQVPGLRTAATAVWALAAGWLVVLTIATALHWTLYPARARRHHLHPVLAHFYGAPPMALLTVGAGTLLLGRDWIGLPAAVGVDWILWSLGTALGLALHSGLVAVDGLAVLAYLGLVAAWAVVAVRTFHGALVRGTLLAPPVA